VVVSAPGVAPQDALPVAGAVLWQGHCAKLW